MDLAKNHAKLLGKSFEDTRSLHSQRICHTDYLLITKRNMVAKSGRYYLNQETKISINTGTNSYYLPPDVMYWEKYRIIYLLFLQKSIILIMKKYQTNPNWRTFYQTVLYSSKLSM